MWRTQILAALLILIALLGAGSASGAESYYRTCIAQGGDRKACQAEVNRRHKENAARHKEFMREWDKKNFGNNKSAKQLLR